MTGYDSLAKPTSRFIMSMMKKIRIPSEVMEYFRLVGAQGGRARAARHTKEELSAWGREGGRPKGSGKTVKKGGH